MRQDHLLAEEKESRLSHHVHRRSESSTQASQKDNMSLVDGNLSRDTFHYAQDLARVDGNEDDFHVHLFSHDRRAECVSEDRSRRAAWVTPLPFPLKLHGPWYVALKRACLRTQLSHRFCVELTGVNGSSKSVSLSRRPCSNWFDLFGQLGDEVVDSRVVYSTATQTSEIVESGHIVVFVKSKNVGVSYNRRVNFSLDPLCSKGETLDPCSIWFELLKVMSGRECIAVPFWAIKRCLKTWKREGFAECVYYYVREGRLGKGG